jgi:hypothetical protein
LGFPVELEKSGNAVPYDSDIVIFHITPPLVAPVWDWLIVGLCAMFLSVAPLRDKDLHDVSSPLI